MTLKAKYNRNYGNIKMHIKARMDASPGFLFGIHFGWIDLYISFNS
jgi:hypothetical protein